MRGNLASNDYQGYPCGVVNFIKRIGIESPFPARASEWDRHLPGMRAHLG